MTGRVTKTMGGHDVHNPLFARIYTRLSAKGEERGAAEHRKRLLAGLSGRVVEVGAGHGLNLSHYPSSVSEVVAVEPESYLRARGGTGGFDGGVDRRRRRGCPPARRRVGGRRCRIVRALHGARPGARAGGAPPRDPPRRRAPFLRARRLGSPCGEGRRARARRDDLATGRRGCHLARDTQAAIERAGFEIASCERFAFGPGGGPIRIAHILGVAKRP